FGAPIFFIDPHGPRHLRQRGQEAAIDGGQAAQKFGVFASVQGQCLLREFADDGLQRLGIENACGLAERTQGNTRAAELLAHLGDTTGPLQGTQTVARGIEEEQENERAILIEKQRPIAGAIPFGAHVVQAREEGLKLFEIFQPANVVGGGFRLAWHDATVVSRLSDCQNGRKERPLGSPTDYAAAFMPNREKPWRKSRMLSRLSKNSCAEHYWALPFLG